MNNEKPAQEIDSATIVEESFTSTKATQTEYDVFILKISIFNFILLHYRIDLECARELKIIELERLNKLLQKTIKDLRHENKEGKCLERSGMLPQQIYPIQRILTIFFKKNLKKYILMNYIWMP